MSRLLRTIEADDTSSDGAGGPLLTEVEDDLLFEMQPTVASKRRKTASVQQPALSFLDGLLPAAAPSVDANLAPRRSHAALAFDRVQDRIAMKRFNAQQQRRQRSGEDEAQLGGEHDDDTDEPFAQGDSDDGHEGSISNESDEGVGDEDEGQLDTHRRLQSERVVEEDSEAATQQPSGGGSTHSARSGSAGATVSTAGNGSASGSGVEEWQRSKAELHRIADFSRLRLSKPLMRAVSELGYSRPTPVQSGVIPYAVAGRDILANAETGSGKTAAFILPVLERLFVRANKRSAVTRVLVLLPTRELASQCMAMTERLGKYADIRCALVVGGLSMAAQEQALRQRPDIVLATPGRLIDHMRNTASVHLDELEVLVLDEADRLLELGFVDELREIVRMCPRQRQTMLFSATLSPSVRDLVLLSLNQPVRVTIDPFDSVVERLTQEFVRIKQQPSAEAETREREALVLALCQRSLRQRVLVFCQSKEECHRLFLLFSFFQLRAAELQGNLTQSQRMESLELFRSGAVSFLICTDLASRGLDIADVSAVVNTSMPAQLRLYIHRVGRTARAGQSGRAVTLVGFHERKSVKSLMKRTTEAVHARVVASSVVARYRQRIEQLQDDIAAVTEQERMDKAERVAEMEVNRARNTLLFEADIRARPAKTWFQSQQDKLVSRAAAVHSFLPHNDATQQRQGEDEDGSEPRGDVAEEASGEGKRRGKGSKAAAAAAKDSLRGLSRAQKRRRLMREEAEREAAERLRAARAEDPTVSADDVRYIDPIQQATSAAKAAKRKALRAAQVDPDREAPATASGKRRTGEKRKRGADTATAAGNHSVRLAEDRAVDKRFRVKHVKGRVDTEPTTKRRPEKSRKAFKSAGKHKRR